MVSLAKPILQSPNFIVLDRYTAKNQPETGYQSESDLERELLRDLKSQGYDVRPDIKDPRTMLANLRTCIQGLNQVAFSDSEWNRFTGEYLNRPNESVTDRTRKIHDDSVHDFRFDDGQIRNIHLFDRKRRTRNRLQAISQFSQTGARANRYDVTLLVNGLPMVQIELKRRGAAIREAFGQIRRYRKESFSSEGSLYSFLQIFVISNGTDTLYFPNSGKSGRDSFDFAMNWADAGNDRIRDLRDFTATFLERRALLDILLKYPVLTHDGDLLVMRPYQIAAVERILWKIRSSCEAGTWNRPEGGGYVWHTTGSGKTLTSFKAAKLAAQMESVDRVLFVVDRKDLDYQTMKEYSSFDPDSVIGTATTSDLKRSLERQDSRITVTTVQKLNNLMKSETCLPAYGKRTVFIFDECHRSQFGETQKNLRRRFSRILQFGFTGTPIFPENAQGSQTTAGVFGHQLHAYTVIDAIRDGKVLKFKVDYNDVRPKFRVAERSLDGTDASDAARTAQALLHPDRIESVSRHILDRFADKTRRVQPGAKGFNAMFAVSGVEAAKRYYRTLNRLQAETGTDLKIATIFSCAANEKRDTNGAINEERLDPSAMDSSAKDFMQTVMDDFNALFRTNHGMEGNGFETYYRDLAHKVRRGDVDLLIVVGMFLTGFDAPNLNTLFVDRHLRYHGLIQAFSRTNRIADAAKAFGNIVAFRNIEKDTKDAIRLFASERADDIVLERSYRDCMRGFTDPKGNVHRGFNSILTDLRTRFPDPTKIDGEKNSRDFIRLFGEYLRMENILGNYDEFAALKALRDVNASDPEAIEAFRAEHSLDSKTVLEMQATDLLSDRQVQDMRSVYSDIRDRLHRQKESGAADASWNDVTFEVDLLKSQDIDLDYILGLLFERSRTGTETADLKEEIRRMLRASLGHRAKESLIVGFIDGTDLARIETREDTIEAFHAFADAERRRRSETLIAENRLNREAAIRYIALSLKRGFASDSGTDLDGLLPKMSRLKPEFHSMKQDMFRKISTLVETFRGTGSDGN